MKRLLLLLAFLPPSTGWLSGCSWIFVQPLPDRSERGDFSNCTTSVAAPLIDSLFTATNTASLIYVAGEDNVKNEGVAVTIGLLDTALWMSSAIYGYSHTSECRDARDEAEDRPPRRLMRRWVPAVGYPQPPVVGSPTVTPSASSPSSPGQQEDDGDSGRPAQPQPQRSRPPERPDAPRFGG